MICKALSLNVKQKPLVIKDILVRVEEEIIIIVPTIQIIEETMI